ncbi:neuroligin-4, X-linked-like [Physella acuta]|uniref:neuroligin-4, X-linked-like n=1 Tax=Physella acuta TaxID=109671 RepID=UPI0027DD8AB0|nr:neuroligin-4, X-linked-like [Physella acuta]
MPRFNLSVAGTLRLARPEPPDIWSDVKDALVHGAKCLQRIIKDDPPLTNVPFDEDCLFLDIYMPKYKNESHALVPTMMFIHGGGFYGGTGALYNFTNVALRGVAVVSINYRLDVFGFLSTLDETIPGNFGLLDQVLALEWVKNNIANFGGDPQKVTLFGGSAGSLSASILTLSPLTRGKFQGAIMQSAVALCAYSHQSKETVYEAPREVARQLGQLLNCSLLEGEFSAQLLECIRSRPGDVIINQSVILQEETYYGSTIYSPVLENVFGVLPDTPLHLVDSKDKVYIPTISGYTTHDGSWLVSDPNNKGFSLEEFKLYMKAFIERMFLPRYHESLLKKALDGYLPANASELSRFELRDILVTALTDAFDVACTIDEASRFTAGAENSRSFVFEFNHRPSYSANPAWMGVAHADEKGFVLGLPVGPDPFMYPSHSQGDLEVADLVVTTWTNFAKFGNPTPEPVHNITWSSFTQQDQNVLVLSETPKVKKFDRPVALEVWLVDNGHHHNLGVHPREGSHFIVSMLLLGFFFHRF